MEAILTRAVTNLSSDLPEWAGLLLDRARNRFVLERYHQALDDVRQAERILGAHTSIERDDSKKQLQSCQTIRARCLYALGRWKEAEEAYRMSENSAPPDAESSIVSELKHCRLRIQEQSTGRYNYAELFRQVHRDGIRRFDIAGWKGPIEVAQYAGMGRGYRTTREVKAGELLLVEKALSVVTRATASEISDSPRLTGFNLFTETIEGSRLHSLRMDLAYKAAHRPGLGQALRGLYDGSQSKSAETHSTAAASIDQATISDSRHIDGIVTYNVFTLRDLDYAAFADRVRSERGDQA
jgi:tetratricopeptide (TPR) repeat protein